MPQCKMSYCKEPALPTGKRYCAAHKKAYLEKQTANAIANRLKPDCPTEGCKNKVYQDHEYCRDCARDRAEAEEQENREARRREVDFLKRTYLEECETVADLRQWIKEYML